MALGRRWPVLLVVLSIAAMCGFGAIGTDATAAVCGDVNDDDTVSVTDGIVCLRAAAGLASDDRCDIDGDGTVSVTDGIGILRNSIALAAVLSCKTQIGTVIGEINKTNGLKANSSIKLNLGTPPNGGSTATL